MTQLQPLEIDMVDAALIIRKDGNKVVLTPHQVSEVLRVYASKAYGLRMMTDIVAEHGVS